MRLDPGLHNLTKRQRHYWHTHSPLLSNTHHVSVFLSAITGRDRWYRRMAFMRSELSNTCGGEGYNTHNNENTSTPWQH